MGKQWEKMEEEEGFPGAPRREGRREPEPQPGRLLRSGTAGRGPRSGGGGASGSVEMKLGSEPEYFKSDGARGAGWED